MAAQKDFIVEVPPGSSRAIWAFEGPNDVNGTASVELIGVPNYLSLRPGELLVPEEALR